MSKISGGIFGRVRQKTGDIVFSQARDRKGTVNTLRQLVIPRNPRTDAQVKTRTKFGFYSSLLRSAGKEFYNVALDRYVGQLPAFQSLCSEFMRCGADEDAPLAPRTRIFGDDFALQNVNAVHDASKGVLTVSFDIIGDVESDTAVGALGAEFTDEPLVSTDIVGNPHGDPVSGPGPGTITTEPMNVRGGSGTGGFLLIWVYDKKGIKKGNAVGLTFSV